MEVHDQLEPTMSFQVAADEVDAVLTEPTRPPVVVESAAAAAAAPAEVCLSSFYAVCCSRLYFINT